MTLFKKKWILDMKTIQVGQFKAEFSSILEQVQNDGEKFVIECEKKNKKIAILIPYDELDKKREIGIYKGQAKIPDDINKEDEEINDMFYQEIV